LVPEPDPDALNIDSATSCASRLEAAEDPPDDATWSFVR
jgi:hypothetical protein